MASLAPQERALQLHETLKVGLAHCAMRLSGMPFGFCNVPSIKKVNAAYVQNFQQVMEFEHNRGVKGLCSREYRELTRSIFNQHRATMLDVAKGVFEFHEDLTKLFGNDVELAEIRADIKPIRDVEDSLDEFFTERLTLRLLISHVHNLESIEAGGARGNLSTTGSELDQDMAGVVNKSTRPLTLLARAYTASRFMCLRDFQVVPDLLINGVPHEEYMRRDAAKQQHFAYVQTHLFYILLELVKNAARASIERAQQEAGSDSENLKLAPMRVIVPEDQKVWDSERSVKLADKGTGMERSVLQKAFCYFYSSAKARPTVADEVSDFDQRAPLAGHGFGLPVSRVMARYFHGDIDLNSIPGQGTDVYIYL